RVPPAAGRAPAAQILASLPVERSRELTGRTYVVKRGDTLSRIAQRHGVSMQALASANGIRKPSQIHVGRRLRIPGGTEQPVVAEATPRPARAAASTAHHTVRRGETLASIARRYGVSTSALASANGLRNPNQLVAGRRLVIPAAGRAAPAARTARASTRTYTVRPGDTLS